MVNAKDLKEQAGSLNILYVEDEAMLRDSMQNTLEKFFKNTFGASNGQEAFEIFKKEDIDLVITDINMPIMSGIELIQSIHKFTSKEPIIIVLSAHNESKLLTNLINMGINNFINKPLDKAFLINTLYKACTTINDKKLLAEYEIKLQNELEAMERKNRILEQKLKQLAVQTNKNVSAEKQTTEKKEKRDVVAHSDYYSTLMMDDKDELEDLSIELDNFIAIMFQNEKLHSDYIDKLSNVYKKYASVLNNYQEFFEVASLIYDLSESMLNLKEKFMQDISQTGIYFESLQLTLENFRQNVWNKEAKNPMFYNASLKNDIKLVTDFLEDKEALESEIEFF